MALHEGAADASTLAHEGAAGVLLQTCRGAYRSGGRWGQAPGRWHLQPLPRQGVHAP